MANVITLKFGSGPPSANALKQGEVGLDLTNKVIYTSTDGSDIVEMSRNMGEGGTINWGQIEGVPAVLQLIVDNNIPNYSTFDALVAQVKSNEDAISALETIDSGLQGQIDALVQGLADLAVIVDKNTTDIGLNANAIGANTIAINGNTTAIGLLDDRVTINEGDITNLENLIDKELTGLFLAGSYDAEAGTISQALDTAVDANGDPLFLKGNALNSYIGGKYQGYYFVVDVPGTLKNTGTPARADGEMAYIGDWMVSDGPHWLHFNFSQESTIWGTIGGDINTQADLQAQFATKLDLDADIVGGNY